MSGIDNSVVVIAVTLKDVLKKAITQYNKYRSPEVTATVLSTNEKLFKIQFI